MVLFSKSEGMQEWATYVIVFIGIYICLFGSLYVRLTDVHADLTDIERALSTNKKYISHWLKLCSRANSTNYTYAIFISKLRIRYTIFSIIGLAIESTRNVVYLVVYYMQSNGSNQRYNLT